MKLLWVFMMTQLAWLPSRATSYHEISVKTFVPPTFLTLRENSYFGYSVAYQPNIKSLIISAPRETIIGNVYSCDIDTRNCSALQTNLNIESPDYNHDYWLGATVKAGSDYFVTCAPRHVERDSQYGIFGEFSQCFTSNGIKPLRAARQIELSDRTEDVTNFEETMDSFGWSIDIGKDKDYIIGGPAMFTGRVMKQRNLVTIATNGRKSQVNVKYNFGYSVAVGNFFSTTTSFYAVGSPFGEDGHGKVVFFDARLNVVDLSLSHESVGTMFGAVLATAHISGQKTDLLVGAPAYATLYSYNVGAVYYYKIKRQRTLKPIKPRCITGRKEGSHFGSAITSVGDLNGDGKDEIAIAAPYEDDGRGAVYLYCGTVFLIESTSVSYLQRIQPAEKYHTFGLSLSALSDYDENGCNELAIGAPDSNRVFMYSCMSSVILNLHANFPNLQNRRNPSSPYPDRNETYFMFQSCIDVKYPEKLKKVTARIEVTVQINHESAVLAMPHKDGKYVVSLHEKNPVYCENVGVDLPLDGNYGSKINYKIQASLLDSPLNRSEFDVSRVLLSDLSILTYTGSVWAAECNEERGCMPDLSLTIISTIEDTYLLGSETPMDLSFIIKNTGEVAYDACLFLKIEGAPILSAAASSCTHTEQRDQLKCAPSGALRTDGSWTSGVISIDTKVLTNQNKFINVTTRLLDHCNNPKVVKEDKKIVALEASSDGIVIKGTTNIGDVINMTMTEVRESGKQFEHIYTITNAGMTTWVEVPCEVTLPKLPYVNYSDNAVIVYTEKSFMVCDINRNESDVISASCLLEKLDKTTKLQIVVSIEIPPKMLENILNHENAKVYTNVTLNFDGVIKERSIVTEVALREFPWWIIVVATIVGLLILIILICVLRRIGFLKRKNKQKLKDLRQSVRRQTIRRSMMQQHSEDRRRLTGVPVEIDDLEPACSTGASNRIEIKDHE